MDQQTRSKHWEHIHKEKPSEEYSWYQKTPKTSLDIIHNLHIPTDRKIIDIGGGDSFLVDFLISSGFRKISVLDISAEALIKVQSRLGFEARKIEWIVSDINEFEPSEGYDVWHDRAAFHFLIEKEEVARYVKLVGDCINPGGYLIIGTFSEQGPETCSGFQVRRYSTEGLKELFKDNFETISCKSVNHFTPLHNVQNFSFCVFERK